jgi:hypothetical protein
MHRASLAALAVAAFGLVPAIAHADCHLPHAEGTIAEEHGAPRIDGDAGGTPREAADAGDGEEETSLAELDAPEESAILPSAEGHLESEAPTMKIDCQENPELCAGEPLLTESEGPALSTGDDPETTPVENAAGEPVVAEADC